MLIKSVQMSIGVLTDPAATFDRLKTEKHSAIVPFALVFASIAAVLLYYFANVDFAWLKSSMLDQMAAASEIGEDELALIDENMTASSVLWSTMAAALIGTLLLNAILAWYLNITAKWLAKDAYGYRDWFAFSWWFSMPVVASSMLSTLLVLFSKDGRIALEGLSVTNLNSLVFDVDATNAWFGLANSLDLFYLWSLTLIAISLKSWLGINLKPAAMIAVAPSAVIFGGWALMIISFN